MQQMVFTFLHAMMLYRKGVQNCNSDAAESGKAKLAKLFYTRNHPKYQRILAVDKLWNAMMPVDMKVVMEESYSVSRTGRKGHYQGADACLEEINKNGKAWISPHGVPANEEWLKVFRNLDQLNQVFLLLIIYSTCLLHFFNNTEILLHMTFDCVPPFID